MKLSIKHIGADIQAPQSILNEGNRLDTLEAQFSQWFMRGLAQMDWSELDELSLGDEVIKLPDIDIDLANLDWTYVQVDPYAAFTRYVFPQLKRRIIEQAKAQQVTHETVQPSSSMVQPNSLRVTRLNASLLALLRFFTGEVTASLVNKSSVKLSVKRQIIDALHAPCNSLAQLHIKTNWPTYRAHLLRVLNEDRAGLLIVLAPLFSSEKLGRLQSLLSKLSLMQLTAFITHVEQSFELVPNTAQRVQRNEVLLALHERFVASHAFQERLLKQACLAMQSAKQVQAIGVWCAIQSQHQAHDQRSLLGLERLVTQAAKAHDMAIELVGVKEAGWQPQSNKAALSNQNIDKALYVASFDHARYQLLATLQAHLAQLLNAELLPKAWLKALFDIQMIRVSESRLGAKLTTLLRSLTSVKSLEKPIRGTSEAHLAHVQRIAALLRQEERQEVAVARPNLYEKKRLQQLYSLLSSLPDTPAELLIRPVLWELGRAERAKAQRVWLDNIAQWSEQYRHQMQGQSLLIEQTDEARKPLIATLQAVKAWLKQLSSAALSASHFSDDNDHVWPQRVATRKGEQAASPTVKLSYISAQEHNHVMSEVYLDRAQLTSMHQAINALLKSLPIHVHSSVWGLLQTSSSFNELLAVLDKLLAELTPSTQATQSRQNEKANTNTIQHAKLQLGDIESKLSEQFCKMYQQLKAQLDKLIHAYQQGMLMPLQANYLTIAVHNGLSQQQAPLMQSVLWHGVTRVRKMANLLETQLRACPLSVARVMALISSQKTWLIKEIALIANEEQPAQVNPDAKKVRSVILAHLKSLRMLEQEIKAQIPLIHSANVDPDTWYAPVIDFVCEQLDETSYKTWFGAHRDMPSGNEPGYHHAEVSKHQSTASSSSEGVYNDVLKHSRMSAQTKSQIDDASSQTLPLWQSDKTDSQTLSNAEVARHQGTVEPAMSEQASDKYTATDECSQSRDNPQLREGTKAEHQKTLLHEHVNGYDDERRTQKTPKNDSRAIDSVMLEGKPYRAKAPVAYLNALTQVESHDQAQQLLEELTAHVGVTPGSSQRFEWVVREAKKRLQKRRNTTRMKADLHAARLAMKQTQYELNQLQQTPHQDDEPLTFDIGLVILWPFLPTLFSKLQLLHPSEHELAGQFVNNEAQMQAHAALCYIANIDPLIEVSLTVNALLGLPLYQQPEQAIELDDAAMNAIDAMLNALVSRWEVLKGMPKEELIRMFIAREGTVENTDTGCHICAVTMPQDVLMSKLPWGLGMVQLPWLGKALLHIEWKYGF
ncbi:hypothetical protein BGP78_01460 [Pseudoalteromonas sp. MSK9-3]|uniref:contractile injection system tape measure protein n=1 Tax=Pseudoalteromonas sp. MSK9-3 TaxID=1897633 RepID=UPI000E6CDE46|nr:contractile injection system tape measure protein [Pseudoalteromonas sp. MSK9-3]RJE76942.1 hypothetical protein BGP78_01460 [Pseudoalteromonas sp. MSK9-3]